MAKEEGFTGRLKIVPKARRDVQRLNEAHDFGSRVDIALKRFRIEGSPALNRESTGRSRMTIESPARKLRVGITAYCGRPELQVTTIELNAELARGARGFELRSADAECPLQFVLRLASGDDGGAFSIEILYERWNGRPLSDLRPIEALLGLARCFRERGRVTFETIEFGERRAMLSTMVAAGQTARFKRTVETLEFLRRVSQVCRSIASVARYRSSDEPDAAQCQGLALGYALTQQPVVRLKNFTFVVNPTTEGRSALSSGAIYPVVLTMSLRLGFGDTTIGEMPVKAMMKDYVVKDNDNGSFTLHAKAGVEISRDCP